jgi:glycosyltransferase involved in cell wall biosynthesis
VRIVVASAFPADSRFAHAINTIKMADGFAKLGHDVTLLCRRPPAGRVDTDALRQDFGLASSLNVLQLSPRALGFPLNDQLHFALQAAWWARRLHPDFAYCRNYIAPVLLSRLGIRVAAESHAHPGAGGAPLGRMVHASARQPAFRTVVTIAPILRDHFVSLGVPEDKVLILPDGVDLKLFRRPESWKRPVATQRPRVVYAGHLYDYKGIPTVLDAAAQLQDCDFVLVGGTEADIRLQRERISSRGLENVTLEGLLPHNDVPHHLWSADVLVLPPSGRHPSANWTSPVKLGEYLASGVPVAATRIPALQYWLRDEEVMFVEPDDPASLAQGIRRLLADSRMVRRMTTKARLLAEALSYERRCDRILDAALRRPSRSSILPRGVV